MLLLAKQEQEQITPNYVPRLSAADLPSHHLDINVVIQAFIVISANPFSKMYLGTMGRDSVVPKGFPAIKAWAFELREPHAAEHCRVGDPHFVERTPLFRKVIRNTACYARRVNERAAM